MSERRPAEPDELEVQLLQVCFLPPTEATAAWQRELSRSLSIDSLPVELHGLLPLLHRRLVELDLPSPDLGRLQGVRRRLWVQNELRLRSVRTALDQLEGVGVSAALLGGLALLVGHRGRTDLRPLHDADLLVRATDAATAREALEQNGWRIDRPWRGGFLLDLHGVRCTDRQGQPVSLRWSTSPPYDDAVEHAVTAVLGDASFAVVSDADLLLHTVLDGPRAHWTSDALTLLLDAEPDWHRLAASAAARRGGGAVTDALALLDRIVPLHLPPAAAAALTPAPASRRLRAADPAGRPTLLRAYRRRTAGDRPVRALRGVPSYLCEVWDVPSPARLPREVARRARRRLSRRR